MTSVHTVIFFSQIANARIKLPIAARNPEVCLIDEKTLTYDVR